MRVIRILAAILRRIIATSDDALWEAYLSHPSALAYAQRVVRGE